MEMGLIADAVNLHARGEQFLNDVEVFLLLATGPEDLILVDPKGELRQLAGFLENLGVEGVAEHGVDADALFPSGRMVQRVPLGDPITNDRNFLCHASQHLFTNGLRVVLELLRPRLKRTPSHVVTAHGNVMLCEPSERLIQPRLAKAAGLFVGFLVVPSKGLEVIFKDHFTETLVYDGSVFLAIRRRVVHHLRGRGGAKTERMALQDGMDFRA